MPSILHRRLFVPFVLLAVITFILLTSSFQTSQHFRFRTRHTSNGVSAKAAAAARHSVEKSADMVYPLFDYTYEKIIKLSAESKTAKDPCIDLALPHGGAVARPGEGIKVLVTGGAGFIGSNLIDRLLQLGYSVRIFDNLYTGFLRNVPIAHPNVEFFLGDILDKEALKAAVDGVDFVYHLAAMSKVVPSIKTSAMARFCTETNALGSWNVLDAVRENEKVQKVIYAGSSTFYGNQPAPHKEDMAPDFLTPYAASKYEGELQMQMFNRLFGVPTISNRFFMVYGPRQPSTGAYAIVTGVFAKQAAEGKPLTIEGDGSHYRDFIHVTDIVEGLILSQQHPDLRGDVINLGSGSAFSVQDVANLVSSDQTHIEARANDLVGTLADTCKMKRLLGFKAKKNFKTEMSYMAKETMKGNVFMQSWVTPTHAMSAPHLLAAGSPMFSWPNTTSDLDALLLSLKHVEAATLVADESASRRISVLMFDAADKDMEPKIDLLLNTIFSLVRFAGIKTYIVAATDDKALTTCISLNLPCYDARTITVPALILSLVSGSYDVHLAQLGNSYVSKFDTVLSKVVSDNGQVDVIGARPQGDVFIYANDRTKAAMKTWARSVASSISEDVTSRTIYSIDKWPKLEISKASFSVERYCRSQWVGPAKASVATQTTSSHAAKATLSKRGEEEEEVEPEDSEPVEDSEELEESEAPEKPDESEEPDDVQASEESDKSEKAEESEETEETGENEETEEPKETKKTKLTKEPQKSKKTKLTKETKVAKRPKTTKKTKETKETEKTESKDTEDTEDTEETIEIDEPEGDDHEETTEPEKSDESTSNLLEEAAVDSEEAATTSTTSSSTTSQASSTRSSSQPSSTPITTSSKGFSCSKGFYIAIGCATTAAPKTAAATIKALKLADAWHLSDCQDAEHCDRQQVVPLRWVSHPPDLAPVGGIC